MADITTEEKKFTFTGLGKSIVVGANKGIASFIATPYYLGDLVNAGSNLVVGQRIYAGPTGDQARDKILNTSAAIENAARSTVGIKEVSTFTPGNAYERGAVQLTDTAINTALGVVTGGATVLAKQSAKSVASAEVRTTTTKVEPMMAATGAKTTSQAKPAGNGMDFDPNAFKSARDELPGVKAAREKAEKEAAEAASKKSADSTAKPSMSQDSSKAVKEELDEKAKAGWGEQAKNWVNRKFENSNWLVRNLLGAPLGVATGVAVRNPIKTALATDLAINAAGPVAPENKDKGLLYNAAGKTVADVTALGGAALTGTAAVASVIPVIGKPVGTWLYENGKSLAAHIYVGLGDALDGAVDQAAKELGVDNKLHDSKIPALPGPVGRLAASAHNHAVKAREQAQALAQKAPQAAADAADTARQSSADAVDQAKETIDDTADKLAELNASMGPMAVLKDPKRALSALRDMPGMSELVDKAKDYPLLSLGLIGGMIMGGFTDAHSKTEKIGNILKGAMLFGVILDAISWFTGGKSMIANSVKMVQQELNQPPKPAAVPAPAVDTPAAPALTTQAPATPAPAPVAVAPLVTREPSVIASTFNNGAVVAAAVAAPVIALPANTAVQPAIAYQGPTTKDLQSGDTTNLGALAFKPAVANAPVFGENQVASVHEKPKPKDVFLTAPEPSFG